MLIPLTRITCSCRVNFVESRLLWLLVRLHADTGVVARPWPERFATAQSNYPFSGVYYLALSKPDPVYIRYNHTLIGRSYSNAVLSVC